MSTRSFIGKKIGNKVKYFFCHWDGYVDGKSGVGFTLNKYYNDERTVDELFDSVGGRIESLEKTPEETVADLQKVAEEYPRLGKELEEDQQKIVNFYTYLRMRGAEGTEWMYIYDDGEWYYTEYEMEGFHSLKDTMTDYGLYAIYENGDRLNFSPGDEDAARDYCRGLEGSSARVVDTKTGKQICATLKWFREHDDDMKENFHRRGRMLKEGKGGYQLCVGQIFKCDATTGEPKTKNLLDSRLIVDSVDELIDDLKKIGLVPEEYSRDAFYLNLYDFPKWGQITPYIDCIVDEDDPYNEYLVRCGDVCLYDENEGVYKEIGGSRKNWLGLEVVE